MVAMQVVKLSPSSAFDTAFATLPIVLIFRNQLRVPRSWQLGEPRLPVNDSLASSKSYETRMKPAFFISVAGKATVSILSRLFWKFVAFLQSEQ